MAQDEVIIWSENWTGCSAEQQPSEINAMYSQTDISSSKTKIYNEIYAGGTAPELLVTANGSWTVNISDLKGCYGDVTLSFLSNKTSLSVKANGKNVSLTTSAIVIGLVDGFNPCAMWILLFLISVLIGMKDRKKMWILGLTFLLTSALVYMLIMLSWINIAVKITTIVWIRNIIALVAIIGGLLNLRSFIKSNDSGCDVVDKNKRKTIFNKIKKFTHEKSFFLSLVGVMGLAISVNLVELACSAGLPIVFSELLALNNVSNFMKFMYTLIYIFFFLIDDLIVFFIAMFTMKVSGISTKYNKYSHVLGGIIMLVVGILLIFKPEWLMFNFG